VKKDGPKNGPWGGARPGAGRPKSRFAKDAPHRARPELSSKNPVHVVLRTMLYVPRLRQAHGYRAIRTVLLHYLDDPDFRIVHLSIQGNHLHFLVEAANKRALSRGMQSL